MRILLGLGYTRLQNGSEAGNVTAQRTKGEMLSQHIW